jgi:hypothetical protein
MMQIPCAYLQSEVELTDERQQHILDKHPDLLPEYVARIAATVSDPDEVRRDGRFSGTYLFARWFAEVNKGKFVVVAVVSDPTPAVRHWVVTAYSTRRLRQGVIEWKRN